MAGELSADEQIGEEHSFAIQEAASSEEQNVAGELSADEQIQAHSFATLRSSVRRAEECRKRKRQKRCCRPRDGEDPRAADWDRHELVDGALAWQHWFSRQIEMRPEIAYYRSLNADAFNGNAAARDTTFQKLGSHCGQRLNHSLLICSSPNMGPTDGINRRPISVFKYVLADQFAHVSISRQAGLSVTARRLSLAATRPSAGRQRQKCQYREGHGSAPAG